MSLDSRGIRRGHCIEYGCPCIGYDGGVEMKRCTRCPHPPGKHTNLSNAGGVGSSASYVPAAYPMGSHATPHNLGNHNFGGNPHYNAGGSVPQLYPPSHFQSQHHHQPTRPHPQLPECRANGCYNRVYCDPSLPEGLREFFYCSPECRDRHLLPLEKVNLTVDLDTMKKKLQEVAAAEKRSASLSGLQRQSSYESSRPAGSSAFPGNGHVLGSHNSSGVSNAIHGSPSIPGGSGSSSGATSPSTISVRDGHHASGVGSSTTTAGGGRVLDTSGKQAKEQRTSMVIAMKKNYEPFGVLLSKRPYYHFADKKYKFMIVGVRHGSAAYSEVQKGKIKIFDVIEKVNDKMCSDLHIPGKDPQESFDQDLNVRAIVTLHLLHSVALPSISRLLAKAQRLTYTHLIALKYSPSCTERAYGLSLNLSNRNKIYDVVLVGGRTVDTPARDSGLEYNDEIRMYAFASEDGTIEDGEEGTELDEDKLDKAQSDKKCVILLIWRPSVTAC